MESEAGRTFGTSKYSFQDSNVFSTSGYASDWVMDDEGSENGGHGPRVEVEMPPEMRGHEDSASEEAKEGMEDGDADEEMEEPCRSYDFRERPAADADG